MYVTESNRNDVDPVSAFDRHGYDVVRSAIGIETANVFSEYALSYLRLGTYFSLDEKSRSVGRYADGMGEALLVRLKPTLESVAGAALYPAYSYLRFYTPESQLTKHVDRPSCEVSATMTIGYRTQGGLWPIYVESGGQDIAVPLDVGDLMVYKGAEVPHWRDRLADGFWLQLFLHYVRVEGAYASYRFDERERVGPYHNIFANSNMSQAEIGRR